MSTYRRILVAPYPGSPEKYLEVRLSHSNAVVIVHRITGLVNIVTSSDDIQTISDCADWIAVLGKARDIARSIIESHGFVE